MLPEFIVVEVNTDEYIVAQHFSGVTYRKFLSAIGKVAAETAAEAMTHRDVPAFDPASRAIRDHLEPDARVRIERNDEGIIQGVRGADEDRA